MKLTQPGIVEIAKHYQRFEAKSGPKAMHALVVAEETVEIMGANKRDMGWVERVAYEHKYKAQWPCYLHCEGSVIMRLFGLCMYDALYRQDCWIFQSPVQQTPSNIGNEDDWGSEASQYVVNELIKIAGMDNMALEMFVLNKVDSIGNQRIIGYATEHDSILPVIARCIGPTVLSCCFELIVSNCYYWSGGLPDLLLWDPISSKAKFSEVKGPGDSLSARQAWWLRTLSFAGADACVLYVTDVPKPKPVVKRKRHS
jgi:Fanconi-associated nuclease 1